MTIKLTKDEVLADLRAIADEMEHHRDISAANSYFHNGRPSCLVGHVLARHGMTEQDLVERGVNYMSLFSLCVEGVIDVGADVDDSDVFTLLYTAQDGNDRSLPWGRVVVDAIAAITK